MSGTRSYYAPTPYISPQVGDLDQRLAQMGDELSRRIIVLERRCDVLEGHVAQLAARQTYNYAAQLVGASAVTTSTPFVALGMNLGFTTTTPPRSTRWQVTMDGQLTNNANNGNSYAQLYWGTGAPPTNGQQMAVLGGTAVGLPANMYAAQANDTVPFTLSAIVPVSASGQQVWFDLGYRANPGGAILSNVEFQIVSLLDPLVLS